MHPSDLAKILIESGLETLQFDEAMDKYHALTGAQKDTVFFCLVGIARYWREEAKHLKEVAD